MSLEREKELREQYSQWYTVQELFEEILRMQSGDMWDGFSSQKHKEEEKLMICVFGEEMKRRGIEWNN